MSAVLSGPADVESKLARWVNELTLSKVPQAALHAARDCITDGMGVMLAGAMSKAYSQVAEMPRPDGLCAVVDTRSKTDAGTAALLNGTACHALDFDDTSYAGIVHATAVVLPAVLAAAQETDASGRQLLEAFIAGVEVEYALGLAVTDSLYVRGHWTTATLGVVGAAAGVSKLLGLTQEGIADALRIAANMPIGLRGTHGSTAKPYLCGVAARLGVEAAHAARVGIHGQPGTFEGGRGFAQTLNEGALDSGAFERLGASFSLVSPGVAIKLRPLCSATQAAIEAVTLLMDETGVRRDDIQSVVCYGTSLVVACLPHTRPVNTSQAQFSMQFALACALLHGRVSLDHLKDDIVTDSQMKQWMERVELKLDASLVPADELAACPEAARVEFILRDGRRLEKTVLAATGMPQKPVSQKQLFEKFMDCATRRAGVIEAQALWECLRHIENLPKTRSLISDLVPLRRT